MDSLYWQPLLSRPAEGRHAFVRALVSRYPGLIDSLTEAMAYLDRIEVAGDSQSGYWVRVVEEEDERMLLPTDRLEDRRAAQVGALRKGVTGGARLVVLAGVGIGDICREILRLGGEYPNVGFLIVEPELVRVLIAATLFDLVPLAQSENILWALGRNAVDEMVSICRKNYLYLVPPDKWAYMLGVIPHDAQEAGQYSALVSSLSQMLEPDQDAFERAVEQFINRRFQSRGLVWSYHSPKAYIHLPLLRALLRGFEERGWRTCCELVKEDFAAGLRLAASMIRSVPDLYLFLNGPSSAFLREAGISPSAERDIARFRVIWIVDDLTASGTEDLHTGYSHWDHVFCADRTYMQAMQGCGARRVAFLPAAAAVMRKGSPRKDWSAPISYVGSIQNMGPYLRRLSDRSRTCLHRIAQRKDQERRISFQQIVQDEAPPQSIVEELRQIADEYHATTPKGFENPDRILDFFLYVTATFLQRKRIVECLLPHGLKIFGPESWLETLAPEYRNRFQGPVPFEQVADVYASADLSLNIHSYQCPTCLNSRDFDVIMAGGCLLADWVEDFGHGFFEEEKEVALFRSYAELPDLVKALSSTPDQRDAMKVAARDRLLREHTYAHRAGVICETLGIG
ncbi:MAG TPA: glycosyltransferase [bacterium]|nr:glycosyltransferase [bacterium]HQL61692.1 glycosyltransferase [bacterium]